MKMGLILCWKYLLLQPKFKIIRISLHSMELAKGNVNLIALVER